MAEQGRELRRVYTRELMQRTGWSDEWIRQQERAGKIPAGRRDPGGVRKFWLSDEADAIAAGQPMPATDGQAA